MHNQLRKYQKDENQVHDLQFQFQNQQALIDELNDYLKNKASLEAVEQQEQLYQKLAYEHEETKTNEAKLSDQVNDMQ